MGSGTWSSAAFDTYSCRTRGLSASALDSADFSAQEFYKARYLKDSLNPHGITRECCDSDEHPNSLPVILALDVTGSMGNSAVKVAKRLNKIMTDLYVNPQIKDIEFCVMGIGDLQYDEAPIQMSQFESDIRIAEQLDDMYFEGGGGGNGYESYTAAWYMGARHSKLDCWNRGKKGIIITLGDELPNPYLPKRGLAATTGDSLEKDIETSELRGEVTEKFNVYHLSVDDASSSYRIHNRDGRLDTAWKELLGEDHYKVVNLDNLDKTITDIILANADGGVSFGTSATGIAVDAETVTW